MKEESRLNCDWDSDKEELGGKGIEDVCKEDSIMTNYGS